MQKLLSEKIRFAFFVVLLLAVSQLSAQESPGFIEVYGKAERTVEPDVIVVKVFIGATESAKSESEFRTKENKIFEITADQGISMDNVSVDSYSAYDFFTSVSPKVNKYNLNKAYSIIINNVSQLDKLVPALFEHGIDRLLIDKVEYKDTKKLEQELISEAISDARHKADRVADDLKVSLSDVVEFAEVNDQDFNNLILSRNRDNSNFDYYQRNNDNSSKLTKIKIRRQVKIKYSIQ